MTGKAGFWEYFMHIFSYSPENPLIFTRLYFWGFFLIVLVVFSFIYPKKALRNAFLFFASIFFYYKTSGLFFLLLLFSTFSDFFIGKAVYQARTDVGKKIWVGMSVFINLFVLFYFKYAYFFTDNFNALFQTNHQVINHIAYWTNSFTGSDFRFDRIILPVGISFYTFQTISYSVDIYRGLIKPVKSILDFGFYVSFFPQLVAGPIVRASEFIPQLYKDFSLTREQFGLAIFWIVNGLIKKMFLADYIAVQFLDKVFDQPLAWGGFANLMALYGYTLQVYADFSGYTDMAIGIAMLLGFYLPQNFNSPYKSASVGEFWKRWHMSLSSFLKDYLYIPMGGNRSGSFFSYFAMFGIVLFIYMLSKSTWFLIGFAISFLVVAILSKVFSGFKNAVDTNINLMMTMLLGGLWHGASWNFVMWGGLNGLGLVVFKFWKKITPLKKLPPQVYRFIGIVVTFHFITFTRIWFRAPTWEGAWQIVHQIQHDWKLSIAPQILSSYAQVFWVMLIGFVIHWLPTQWKAYYRQRFANAPLYLQIAALVITVFTVYQVLTADMQPFIYFDF